MQPRLSKVGLTHQLHLEIWGSSGPGVVLAHGFGGSARNFRPQARALASRFRVALYDSRGHARSTPVAAGEGSTEALVGDMRRVARVMGGAKVVVGGLSMGSRVALHYALAHLDGCSGLVLAALPPGSPQQREWAEALAECLLEQGTDRAGEEYVWGRRSRFDPAGAAWIRQGFLEHSPESLATIASELLALQEPIEEMGEQLKLLDIPSLIVVGEADTPSREASHRLAEILPCAELVVIPGAGHVVNLEAPAPFNEALESFLENLPFGHWDRTDNQKVVDTSH